MSKKNTTRLVAAITALVVALGGGGYGGYQVKTQQIVNLQETNKYQDELLGKTVYKTFDLETDFLEMKTDIRELRKEIAGLKTGQDVMDAKLDILVEGYSGN